MAYVESESLSLMFRIIYFNRAPGPLGATDFLKGVHSVSCYSSVSSVFNHLDSLESLKIQVYICIQNYKLCMFFSLNLNDIPASNLWPFISASVKVLNQHNLNESILFSLVRLTFSTLLTSCTYIFFFYGVLQCITLFKRTCCVSLCKMKCFYYRNNSLRILFFFLFLLSFFFQSGEHIYEISDCPRSFFSIKWDL